jgi:hypothetical protein
VRQASFLALTLALVVAAGCGGGSKRLSRQQYASKADAICSRYNREITALKQPSDLAGLGRSLDKLLESFDRAIKDLKGLKPPQNEQATADRWIAQIETLESDLKTIRDRAKSNDLQGVQAAGRKAQGHNRRGNELAKQLGTTACAQG